MDDLNISEDNALVMEIEEEAKAAWEKIHGSNKEAVPNWLKLLEGGILSYIWDWEEINARYSSLCGISEGSSLDSCSLNTVNLPPTFTPCHPSHTAQTDRIPITTGYLAPVFSHDNSFGLSQPSLLSQNNVRRLIFQRNGDLNLNIPSLDQENNSLFSSLQQQLFSAYLRKYEEEGQALKSLKVLSNNPCMEVSSLEKRYKVPPVFMSFDTPKFAYKSGNIFENEKDANYKSEILVNPSKNRIPDEQVAYLTASDSFSLNTQSSGASKPIDNTVFKNAAGTHNEQRCVPRLDWYNMPSNSSRDLKSLHKVIRGYESQSEASHLDVLNFLCSRVREIKANKWNF